ncbi:MAG: PIN domain-containing protein, partial [bacterium]
MHNTDLMPAQNGGKKVFILDTNVLLVDPDAIDNFEDNIVVISMTVLEELDGLKKRSSTEYEARLAIHAILGLTTRHKPGEPVSLKSGGMFVLDASELKSRNVEGFDLTLDKPDNRLLALAIKYKHDPDLPNRVVIVTNDAAVRMKAHALGLASEEYEAVNFRTQVDDLYREPTVIDLDSEQVNKWIQGKSVPYQQDQSEPVIVRIEQGEPMTGFYRDGEIHPYGALVSNIIEPMNTQQELALQVLY